MGLALTAEQGTATRWLSLGATIGTVDRVPAQGCRSPAPEARAIKSRAATSLYMTGNSPINPTPGAQSDLSPDSATIPMGANVKPPRHLIAPVPRPAPSRSPPPWAWAPPRRLRPPHRPPLPPRRASPAAPGLQVTCTVAGTHAGGQPISTSATTATVPHFLIDDDLGVPYPHPSGRQTLAGDAPGSNKFSPQLVVGQDAFNNGILVAPNVLLEDSTGVPRIYIQTATPAATFTTLERIIAQNPDRGRALSREIRTIQAGNTLYPDYRDLVTPIVKQVQIPTFVGGKLVGEPATLTCQR